MGCKSSKTSSKHEKETGKKDAAFKKYMKDAPSKCKAVKLNTRKQHRGRGDCIPYCRLTSDIDLESSFFDFESDQSFWSGANFETADDDEFSDLHFGCPIPLENGEGTDTPENTEEYLRQDRHLEEPQQNTCMPNPLVAEKSMKSDTWLIPTGQVFGVDSEKVFDIAEERDWRVASS